MNEIGAFDWFRIVLSAANVFIIGAIFVARLQVKNWFLEQKEATQAALDAHNEDPAAHSNHDKVMDLQAKFDVMINKMGELTTQLAVLNERMATKVEGMRRR